MKAGKYTATLLSSTAEPTVPTPKLRHSRSDSGWDDSL